MTNHDPRHETAYRLIAPPHTPFHADGGLNLAQVARQAEWLSHSGIDGVFVAGSTGEGLSLTVAERRALAEEWVGVAPSHQLNVFVQVGHNSQPEAVGLAKHAREIGADAVAVLAPFYFRPQSVDQLIDFMEPVAAAAMELPVYYYDIPELTGVRLSIGDFLARGRDRMPNLAGIKFSNSDLIQLQECIQLNDGAFGVLFGIDEAFLAGYVLGAGGAIGSTFNFMGPLFRELIADAKRGDWVAAREKQARVVALCSFLNRVSFVSACKCVMKMLGIDCGPVRAPLQNLTEEQQQDLVGGLEGFDVFSTTLDHSRLAI